MSHFQSQFNIQAVRYSNQGRSVHHFSNVNVRVHGETEDHQQTLGSVDSVGHPERAQQQRSTSQMR